MFGGEAIAVASGGDSGGCGFGGGGGIYVVPRGVLRRELRDACMRPCWTWSEFTMCWRARTRRHGECQLEQNGTFLEIDRSAALFLIEVE
jgi:hypothetical protein